MFGVNTGQLEVWWANRSRQTDMPAVYYPSRVARYNNVWPTDAPHIVIASGLGSNGDQLVSADDALQFNGTSDFASLPYSPAFNTGNTLTIEAWIKPSTLSGRQAVFSTRLANEADSFQLEFGTGNGGNGRVAVSGVGVWVAETGDNALAANEWTHIAYTRKGTGAGSHALYVNGVPQTLISDADYTFADNSSDRLIGSGPGGANFFKGQIGEVRVWNGAAQPRGTQRRDVHTPARR